MRAIRDALGMTSAELAERMGLTQQTVIDLERSEAHDTIKLETLRRAANALDCDLVYFLIPRTGLEDAVRSQALQKARRHIGRVAHHSRLEDQAIDAEQTNAQLDELAAQFIDRRGLWSKPPAAG